MIQSNFGLRSLLGSLKPIGIDLPHRTFSLVSRVLVPALTIETRKPTTVCFEQPSRSVKYDDVKRRYGRNGEFDPPLQDVIDRFHRLRWGAFIHARAGRSRHLYRRSEAERERRKEHILTNRATSFLLNNLLNSHWRKPKYYPEDIYEPYHKRTGVPWDYELKKPKFFP